MSTLFKLKLSCFSQVLESKHLLVVPDGSAVSLIRSSERQARRDLSSTCPENTALPAANDSSATKQSNISGVSEDMFVPSDSNLKERVQTVSNTLSNDEKISYWVPPVMKSLEGFEIIGTKGHDPQSDARLIEEQLRMQLDPHYEEILLTRQSLPIFDSRNELLTAITNNRTVVVSGETGIPLL